MGDLLQLEGVERLGQGKRQDKPGAVRVGELLIGMGLTGAIRSSKIVKAGARARLDRDGVVTIET